ncbi:nickel ABC transporter permease [Virgibacillus siamensis]|uniref:nickel ABC transporter permease n=1 Tax=Virgibacillus siamensis TaxID=480071 RepID=UPI00158A9DCC|nr:nickel ABC transporter permease [Virgibacillus siamensis]
MLFFLLRRLSLMVIVLFLVSIIVFSLVNILPGDPAMLMLGIEATPESLEALREEMGLNDPLYVRYFDWVAGVLQGDLGYSIQDHSPVMKILLSKIPVTLELTALAFIIAIIIALPIGIISAIRKGTALDYTSTTLALTGVSVPSFWLGILLIYVFAIILGWFPPSGYVPLSENIWKSLMLMLLPAITLGTRMAAELMRMVRSSLLEVMESDYIRTGYSKGLIEKSVVFGHALKNALIPVLTVSGLQLTTLFGGTVIVETIFAVPGLGRLILDSILTRDYPVVQGVVLFMALSVVAINFLIDILYSILDPRIKLTGGAK